MKKLTLIFTALVLIAALAACGSSQNELPDPTQDPKTSDTVASDTAAPDDKPDSELTPAAVEKAIADALGSDSYLCDTDIEESWLQNSYGFDLTKIKAYVAKQNAISAVNLDTVIILKVEDGYADTAVDILNSSYAQTVSYIRQYAFGVGKVLNARIYKEGNYVMYILAGAGYDGDDAAEEEALAVSEYEKIDAALCGIFGKTPENLAAVPADDGSRGGFDGGLIIDDDTDDVMLGG